jgi:hypothetical protein
VAFTAVLVVAYVDGARSDGACSTGDSWTCVPADPLFVPESVVVWA